MNDWDEEALREIGSLDAARLAIRGALATIRDLQDINSQAKAEIQDEASKRKHVEAKAAELAAQLEQWKKEAEQWAQERAERAKNEGQWRDSARAQVRAEERARIEEARVRVDEELCRLRAELESMVSLQKEKDQKWSLLKKQVEARDAELLAAQREKLDLSNRFAHDADMLERMRQQRDREIAASIRSRELELEDKQREIQALRSQGDELKQVLAASAQDQELKSKAAEEKFIRDYRAKEQALGEKYAKREAELQSSWSELENGLWARTKDAREKLDKAVNGQFEERARSLADRTKETESHLAARAKELEESFIRKCAEAEALYAQREHALQEGWRDKESKSILRFEGELAHEKALVQEAAAARTRSAEALLDEKLRELALKAEQLDAEFRHRTSLALEEHARKDAERLRAQDDFVAQKAAELDGEHRARISELNEKDVVRQEAFNLKETAASQELNEKKLDLLEQHERAVELEKSALHEQLEQKARTLDEAFRAKVLETERAQAALEEQYRNWKASVVADYALKEKDLDKRWHTREQELLRNHAIAMETQRGDFHIESQKTRDQFEQQRKRSELDFFAREAKAKDAYERLERELKETWAAREDELHKLHEAHLEAAREQHRKELRLHAEHAANETGRVRTAGALEANALREAHQKDAAAKDRQLADKELLRQAEADAGQAAVAKIREKLAEAERMHQALTQDFWARERSWEAERQGARDQQKQLDAAREQKFFELERSLQSVWSRKEAEAAAAHQAALEKQHALFLEDLAQREEAHRLAFDEHKKLSAVDLELQKKDWMDRQSLSLIQEKERLQAENHRVHEQLQNEGRAREKELSDRRKALEAHHHFETEQQVKEWNKREAHLRQQQAVDLAKARAELDISLRERETSLNERYLALEKELHANWASKQQAADEQGKVRLAQDLHALEERAASARSSWKASSSCEKTPNSPPSATRSKSSFSAASPRSRPRRASSSTNS